MPIWFVSPAEFAAASADGVLTITDLAALPSLHVGYADRFHEVLRQSEAANNSKLTMTASGELADGRSFRLQLSAVNTTQRNLRIQIG